MSFSYTQLWHTLSKMGLSKTDFRLKTGISTATLAKMSNNQPVSLDVIGKICECLNCRMDEIVTYQTDTVSVEKWHTLIPDTTYSVSLWFMREQDSFQYFYGFAVPYRTTFVSSRWSLDKLCSSDGLAIWQISGYTESLHVRRLLEHIEKNNTLGDFLTQSGILLSHSKTNAEVLAADLLEKTVLGATVQCYRPSILLEPESHTGRLKSAFQPFHSYDESEPMLCESITSLSKKELYETGGMRDENKMDLILRFFQENHFIAGSPSSGGLIDIGRIGNFELFSWLSGTPESEAIFEYEIIKEKLSQKELTRHAPGPDTPFRMKGIQVTLHSQHLNGDYLLEADAWNANNLVLKEIRQITCSGQDIRQFFPLQECCSEISICLWQVNGSGQAMQLIGTRRISLIRDMYLTTSVTGRQGILEDEWTAAHHKKGTKVKNNHFSYRTSETRHIGSSACDPWRTEIRDVFQDFNRIYGSETAEGAFFPEGWAHHEEFLKYFKKILAQNNTAHVLIIDPFIDRLAISRILRSIRENDRIYEIVTDFNAGRTQADKRIDELEKICKSYQCILPQNFIVSGIQTSRPLLHDRYLILTDNTGKATVYQMSNSLDNTAVSHAASIVKADRRTSAQINTYYRRLIADCQEKGSLKIIFDNTATRRDKISDTDIHARERQTLLPYFNRLLVEQELPELILDEQDHIVLDIKKADEQLCCIAASASASWDSVAKLMAWLLPPYNSRLRKIIKSSGSDKLVPMLSSYLLSTPADDIIRRNSDYEYSTAISLGQAIQREEFPGLLDISDRLLEYRFQALSYLGSCAFRYASEFLAELSLPDFENCLNTVIQQKESVSAELKISLLFVSLLHFLEPHPDSPGDFARKLLASPLSVLRALGVQWHIRHLAARPDEFIQILKNLASPEEQNFALTQMAVHLQVQVCRNRQKPAMWQGYLDMLKSQWPSIVTTPFDKDTMEKYFEPLRMRSTPDICDLIWQMYQNSKTDAASAAAYLTELAFFKSAELQTGKDVIFRISDLQDCCAVLNRLLSMDPEYTAAFQKRLVTLAKKVLFALREPFLRSKNYRKWNQYTDLLCWCGCIRLILQKNGIEDHEDRIFQEAEIIFANSAQTLKESSELYREYMLEKEQSHSDIV